MGNGPSSDPRFLLSLRGAYSCSCMTSRLPSLVSIDKLRRTMGSVARWFGTANTRIPHPPSSSSSSSFAQVCVDGPGGVHHLSHLSSSSCHCPSSSRVKHQHSVTMFTASRRCTASQRRTARGPKSSRSRACIGRRSHRSRRTESNQRITVEDTPSNTVCPLLESVADAVAVKLANWAARW